MNMSGILVHNISDCLHCHTLILLNWKEENALGIIVQNFDKIL